MPFSKPLYFDNILHKKAGPSRETITKFVADTCDETNKSLLDTIDENEIIGEHNFNLLAPRQIAETTSATVKKLVRNGTDYFSCRLSRPKSTIFSEAETKPFVISYCGRFGTGSRLTTLETKHEVTPHNTSYFSPYAYLETVILPSDDTTADMLSSLTSRNSTPDLTTFGKLYATPISDRIHLSFEYSNEACTYDMPTLCSCLVAEAIVLVHKKRPSPSIQVFHIKNNIISYRYTVNIPQEETPQEPSPTRDKTSSILATYERFISTVSPGLALNQDAASIINNSIDYIINTDPGVLATTSSN